MTPNWSQPKPGLWTAALVTLGVTFEVYVRGPDDMYSYYDYHIQVQGTGRYIFRSGRTFNYPLTQPLTTLEQAQQEAWAEACEWAGVKP